MRIYTISKGRLDCVKRLLASLDASRGAQGASECEVIVIFDDERCDELAAHLERWATMLSTIKVAGLRIAQCSDLIAAEGSRWPTKCRGMLPKFLRMPRTGRWQPGGMRNLALAHRRREPPAICFWIDDDIVFGAREENGVTLQGAAASVLETMASKLGGDVLVAGCGYIGREDNSLINHSKQLILGASGRAPSKDQSRRECLQVLEGIPDRVPVRITTVEATHADAYRGPSRVSSGCLALRSEAFDIAPVAYWYNEDWIWLWLLGPSDQLIKRVDASVVHAPPTIPGLRAEVLVQQQLGEAVYAAVRRLLPGDARAGERARAVAEIPDQLLAERLRMETDALLEVAESARLLADGQDGGNGLAAGGALRMSVVFSRAAARLSLQDVGDVGGEVRAYGRLVLQWADTGR